MDENRKILVNCIMTPDGNILISHSRHDYKAYENSRGVYSMADGGRDYLRRGGEYIEMSIYEDDPFEVIRRFLCRGNRGENGDKPLTWVPLCKMGEDWLKNAIVYNKHLGIKGDNEWYEQELEYRKRQQNDNS